MDLSERWRLACQVLGYIAVLGLAVGGFYFVYKVKRGWRAVILFGATSLLLSGTGLALWFDVTFVRTSRMRGPVIPSPDGTHVAVVYWDLSGAVGVDHVNVLVRKEHSPFATEVFRGMAQAPPDEPQGCLDG